MIQLKEMNEFEVEDMKVFKTDDMQWVAAPTLLHALAFLEEQVGELDASQIQDVEQSNIDKEGMWDSYTVTDEEKIAFANGQLKLYEPPKHLEWHEKKQPDFGVYGTFAGELCKYTAFKEVLKKEGVGTYVIACTEY